MPSSTSPRRILVLFAHPALHKSRVHRVLARAVRELPGLTFRDLYERYPDLDIDVREEQDLLLAHGLIIFQHPFFWYSTPAILKEWQDLVLEHGWAYGREGTALAGKALLSVVSTGGQERAYERDGYNRFTMRELLAPIEQTARLCRMEYLPPFIVHGTHGMSEEEIQVHAGDYRALLEAYIDDRLDWERSRSSSRINLDLRSIILEPARPEGDGLGPWNRR